MTYLEMVKTMTLADQQKLAAACLDWSHQEVRALLGETRTLEEHELRQEYIRYLSGHRHLFTNPLYERLRYGAARQKRSYLVRLLKQEVGQVLGPNIKDTTDEDDLIFISPLEQYFVGTRIQITRDSRVRYWQNIMKSKTSPVGLLAFPAHNGTNLCSWLGLGVSEWDLPCLEDAEPGAKSLALVCKHFVDNCHYFV